MKQIERLPFLRLLLPLLAGIISQYYFQIHKWSIIALLIGLAIMLFSYLIPPKKQFNLRWIYGAGLFIFLFCIGSISTSIRQYSSSYTFIDVNKVYNAVISDIPQNKPNSIALKLTLDESNKKIICYLPKDYNSKQLVVGDRISFFSKIEPIKSSLISENFNYATFMHNKGYAGCTYVYADRWEKIDGKANNIFILATQTRAKILTFYQSINLDQEQYAILSALTLGYKDSLTDDLVQSFRTAGVAHIFAVSGMHVGIIYFILSTIFSVLPRKNKYVWGSQIITILILWSYAFVIGFPPSAVRACIMLTLYCFSQLHKTKGYSLNTLLATAFMMLVWNPLWLFDLGFQLSFIAVLCLILLFPIINQKIFIQNKFTRYFWNISLISIFVQIGTFPLCLYYFGTFPSYFFLTNVLIIPIITLIIYVSISIGVLSSINILLPIIPINLNTIPISIYKFLIDTVTQIIFFFEKLPFAQINNLYVSFPQTFLLWAVSSGIIFFFIRKKPSSLILSLICCFMLISIGLWSRMQKKNSLFIYNNPNKINITYYIGHKKHKLDKLETNKILNLKGQKYLLLKDDIWKEKISTNKFNIDYLHIVGNNPISLYSINRKFTIQKVILDGTMSRKNMKRLVSECENLRIPYYDASANGVLRIFF